ncbi:MAG: ABC transporter substrate-binding protein [Cyanobacteria bacterium REEB67]|nr:ABC transporter substrate-binding protein [Cyanobacteria bacterium REEB67]
MSLGLALTAPLVAAAVPAQVGSSVERTATVADNRPIVIGMIFEPVSFNPLRGVDSGSYYASTLVYEGLVKYDADMQLVPALAETFRVSDDGLTYYFKLRENLRFSTGAPITAGDVKASLALAASTVSPFRSDYTDIAAISIDGSKNIEIRLKQRSQPFLSRMAELRIFPAAVTALPDHGNKLLARTPVASGPYRLKHWETGLELVFERNPYYWGKPAASAAIVWRIIPDRTVAAVALAKGEIDLAQVDGRMWQNYLAGNHLTDLKLDQFNGNRTIYLGFNLRKSPFDQKIVRKAFAEALDRDTLARVFFGGYALVADTDTPRANWVFTPTESTTFDLTASAALLRQAGYERANQNAYWTRDGKAIALRILTVKDLEDVADVISDDLIRAGIKSEVEVIEYSTLRRLYLQKGRFDAVLWSRSCGPDPESTIVWSSNGPLNFCGLKSEPVDALLQSGRLASTKAERQAAYGDLQKYLARELPWAFLVQPKLLVAHKNEIINVQKGRQAQLGLPWDNPTFNAADWQRHP